MNRLFVYIYFLLLIIILLISCSCSEKKKNIIAYIYTNKGKIAIRLFHEKTPVTVKNFIDLAEGRKWWIDPETNEKVKKPFYNNLVFYYVKKDYMIKTGCPLRNGTGGPGYKIKDECFEKDIELKGEIDNESDAMLIWEQIILPYAQENRNKVLDQDIKQLISEVQAQHSTKPLLGKTVKFYKKHTAYKKPVYKKRLIHPVEYAAVCMENSGKPNTNGSQFFIVTKNDGILELNSKRTVFGMVVSGMETVHAIENAETNYKDNPLKDILIHKIEIRQEEILPEQTK